MFGEYFRITKEGTHERDDGNYTYVYLIFYNVVIVVNIPTIVVLLPSYSFNTHSVTISIVTKTSLHICDQR